MPKMYPENKIAELLERLRAEPVSIVSRDSGVSGDSLRRWAADAGIPLVDGRKKVGAPIARESSPVVRTARVSPLVKGEDLGRSFKDRLKAIADGFEDYIRSSVREQSSNAIRDEFNTRLGSGQR